MSTFTNFGFGPVDGPSKSDWRALITEYKEMNTALSGKQDKLEWDTEPTVGSDKSVKSGDIYRALSEKQDKLGPDDYDAEPIENSEKLIKSGSVFTAIEAVKANKQDSLEWDTEPTANSEKSLKSGAVYTAIERVKSDKQDKLTDTDFDDEPTENSEKLIKSGSVFTAIEEVKSDVAKLEEPRVIKASEQIQLTFKKFTASVCGTNGTGVYYMLGMLTEQAGTAYIKYSNTKDVAAVIDFALSRGTKEGPFTTGSLSVTTNALSAGLHHLKIYLIQGTGDDNKYYAYLAIQADEWLKKFASDDGYGLFDKLKFEGAGINFVTVESEGYIAPNGETHVISEFDYTGIENRIKAIEDSLFRVGTLQAWPKYDINGIATEIPEDYHACDGTLIDPSLAELIEFIGPTYPNINYHIIRIRNKASNI